MGFECSEHTGKPVPAEGWFLVEIWASGDMGVIGAEPFHPYCAPIPFPTKAAAQEALEAQKPKCMAAGNESLDALSRERKGLVIAHDVWDHAWLRRVLKGNGMKESMIYRLPDGMVDDPDGLFQESLKARNR